MRKSRPSSSSGSRSKSVRRPLSGDAATAEIRRLAAALTRARRRIRELERLAESDALLGILNRRGFERELARVVAYLRRYRGSAAVIMLDVDGLKAVNDERGHAAGDVLLKALAALLRRQTRASDAVGRLGGDEFAIVLWNLTAADARAKAASLEAAIEDLDVSYRGRAIRAGASAGVAMLEDGDDVAAVIERADGAMYARKLQRRARAPAAAPHAMMSGVI
jgi:diguanylate cyclase (GGDEF)-like protein